MKDLAQKLTGDVYVKHVVYDAAHEAEMACRHVVYIPREPFEPYWEVTQVGERDRSAAYSWSFESPSEANAHAEFIANKFHCRLHKWSAPITKIGEK